MQGIAYTIDGAPRLTWPVQTEVLDEEGNATGETASNLQTLIAALPPGTEYELVTDEEAEAWWQARRPASERRAEILARLDALGEMLAKPYTISNALAGDAEAVAVAQAKKAAHDAAAAPLRAELAALQQEEV